MRILRRVPNERMIAIQPAHDKPVEPPSGLKLFCLENGLYASSDGLRTSGEDVASNAFHSWK